MKFLIVLVLSSACTTSAQQVPATVKFLAEDAQLRREGVSYTTSVIHKNPKYPDQHAESTIKVDLHNHRPKQSREIPSKPSAAYQTTYIQKRPKALPTYTHPLQQQFLRQPPTQYAVEEKIPQPNQAYTSIQNPPFSSPQSQSQSQSFNVGYSVSFNGSPKSQSPRSLSRQRLENAEIITGARKDVVRKPAPDFDSDEFIGSPLIDLKKQKVSGIKPKPIKFSGKENDAKGFINNLAPKTQQYLSYLGDTKPVASSNTRFRQQLQSNDAQGVRSAWTNLSPSVEIYHSKDVPQQLNFSPKQQQEQSKNFNHAAALGTSLGFDYTNALEGQNEQKQPNLPQVYQDLSKNTEYKPDILNHPYSDLLGNAPENTLLPFNNPSASLDSTALSSFNALQLPQKSADLQGIAKQFPLLPIHDTASSPKLPINWNFAAEPILVSNGKKTALNDLHTIALPLDMRLFEAAKQQVAVSSPLNHALYGVNKGQVQVDGNAGNVGQQFQGQLENQQVHSLQGINQDAFQDQVGQGQQLQQTQQFNVYGVPQQALFFNKGFDQYFDQYFDKMVPQETRFENPSVKYPKINNGNSGSSGGSSRLRSTKGVGIHTDLQPPPMKIARHRRMFQGK